VNGRYPGAKGKDRSFQTRARFIAMLEMVCFLQPRSLLPMPLIF
jgi:hypothetical protein